MAVGHIISLIGAVLAVVGATLLPWEHFGLAEITAKGYQIPPSGQAVLALGGLAIVVAAVALVAKRRRRFAPLALFLAAGTLAMVIHAAATRETAFELMKYETVELMGGYKMALGGGFTMLRRPGPDANRSDRRPSRRIVRYGDRARPATGLPSRRGDLRRRSFQPYSNCRNPTNLLRRVA